MHIKLAQHFDPSQKSLICLWLLVGSFMVEPNLTVVGYNFTLH